MFGGTVTIVIFLVSQLVIAVWWCATISTKMTFVLNEIKNLNGKEYSTKSEVDVALKTAERETSMALGFAQKELKAIWEKIDDTRERLDEVEKKCYANHKP